MLVLTRRPHRGVQSVIQIGEKITIEVIEAVNGDVRLGITAPKNINIYCGQEAGKVDTASARAAEKR